jgi:hypothetical protein
VRQEACDSDDQLLISIDAKATVKVGQFSRNGQSRLPVEALDHDYDSEAKVTPFGFFLPQYDELSIAVATSKVTSDFIVDQFEVWWLANKERFANIKKLVLLADNGPENSGRRTQYLQRMVQFADDHQIDIRLAYYPPYHSKYNPVERCWGALENYWRGEVLDSVDAVIGFAKAMTWKGLAPVVSLVTKAYESGVRLAKDAMKAVEKRLRRLPTLTPWFIDIEHRSAEKVAG